MSVARDPYEAWEPLRPRLGVGAALVALYWLGASLLAVRAYDLGFHRYQPRGAAADNELVLTIARDAALWGACATAAAAFVLFLGLIALFRIAERLMGAARR